jgi:hypothetical protein
MCLLNNSLPFFHFLQTTIMSNNHILTKNRIERLSWTREQSKWSLIVEILLMYCMNISLVGRNEILRRIGVNDNTKCGLSTSSFFEYEVFNFRQEF